ncbi:MAG: beta-lactamase family protein [Oscillospiraceae bacterium]|nr:beta-lactamase family protein [Oscillospiraceae bacterium]
MRVVMVFGTAFMALLYVLSNSFITPFVMGNHISAGVMAQGAFEAFENPEKKQPPAVLEFDFMSDKEPIYKNTMQANSALLHETLDALAEKHGAVGMSIAAFEHDRIVFRHTYGMQNIEENIPTESKTKYRVASISKLVTSALAMMLEDSTGFSIDDDLSYLYPYMRNPYFADEPVTTRHLITHTSGLIDARPYMDVAKHLRFPSLRAVSLAPGMWLDRKPGTAYEYSNFGMGVVAGVIEAKTGERFYDYAKRVLFDPLSIDAGYSMHLIKNPHLVANIYNQSGQLTAEPGRWTNMDAVYASIPVGEMYMLGHGDLFISAEDLAVIGVILAGDGTYGGRRYISQKALSQMNTTMFIDSNAGVARGLGTFAATDIFKKGTVYGHQGNAYGMISGMFYDPATKTGVVLLSNGCSLKTGEQWIYDINRDVMKEVWRYLVPLTA